MVLCDKFIDEICSRCENRNLCAKDMKQIQACATIEIWNLLYIKKGDLNDKE